MTDEELSIKAQNGDEDAVNHLLTNYKSLVNKIARSYFLTGGDMEDIVQEGMIGLYKAIMHYSPDKSASFKTFANTCIKHQIITAIRIASSEKNKALSSAVPILEPSTTDEEDIMEIPLFSTAPSPDDKIIAEENFQEIKQQITKLLTPLELKVFVLYLQGYSYNEISAKSNINKKSIDNALSRIKSKLAHLKNDENKE
mgnify:CR=1 FL=1